MCVMFQVILLVGTMESNPVFEYKYILIVFCLYLVMTVEMQIGNVGGPLGQELNHGHY